MDLDEYFAVHPVIQLLAGGRGPHLLEIGMCVPDRGAGEIGGRDTGVSSKRHAEQEEKEEQA